jgi:hypothetical protein
LGFSQITLTVPARRITLHLVQIRFTEARTFTASSSYRLQTTLARILPRPGSVADSSITTRSPGRSLTLASRARPAACATTLAPPASSTR